MSNRVFLKDETVLENCICGYADNSLWLTPESMSFPDAFHLFSDPEKTDRIVYLTDVLEMIFTGFTTLTMISQTGDTCSVRLNGEHTSVERRTIGDEN